MPGTVTARHLGRTLGLGDQIDSVNVLSRAHYLPAFSRLVVMTMRCSTARRGAEAARRFEYWAHAASLLPLDLHPLLRWRMVEADRGERG